MFSAIFALVNIFSMFWAFSFPGANSKCESLLFLIGVYCLVDLVVCGILLVAELICLDAFLQKREGLTWNHLFFFFLILYPLPVNHWFVYGCEPPTSYKEYIISFTLLGDAGVISSESRRSRMIEELELYDSSSN